MKIDVLDKGFVTLMHCTDTDLTVVDCARVSFGKESDWEGFDPESGGGGAYYLSAKDTKLIAYLAREGHWSPFSHPQIRLRVKAPIFIRTQLFKHKVGAAENEVSRRYIDDEPVYYLPDMWRGRPDESIKQGSSNDLINFTYNHEAHLAVYRRALAEGVAPELARMVLPQSTYTEWIWTGSLAFFARVYNQRSDPHAQLEAQQYAKAIAEIIEPLFPVSWKALTGGE